ncbi:hypothetical protein C8J57DRAFT_1723563 [Mycena rebaudengoi]|nr:hypothetical protein C8J57DRAFT_1723563 [Mycena rebaudengoi]
MPGAHASAAPTATSVDWSVVVSRSIPRRRGHWRGSWSFCSFPYDAPLKVSFGQRGSSDCAVAAEHVGGWRLRHKYVLRSLSGIPLVGLSWAVHIFLVAIHLSLE